MILALFATAAACATNPSATTSLSAKADYTTSEAHAASGRAASPIDIPAEVLAPDTSDASGTRHQVALHYRDTAEHLVHQQHTIEIQFDEGSLIEFDGHAYSLEQFHFHTPSEHLVGGVRHPIELHLLHRDEKGHVLVVGVLFEMGAASPLLERIISDSPRTPGRVDYATRLSVNELFPPASHYFVYKGSFTTPPYTEGVQWLILKSHPQASAEQIVRLLVLEGGNARDVQPLGNRAVENF